MDIRRILIISGLAILAAGILWPWLGRIGFGHLPGDIAIERKNFTLYIPLGTSIVISVVLTILFWLLRK